MYFSYFIADGSDIVMFAKLSLGYVGCLVNLYPI